MNFAQRQIALVGVVIAAALVAFAFSDVMGPALLPIVVGPPIYLNPIILAALVLFGVVALFTVFRASDQAWPAFMFVLGLWTFLVAFEDSIIQWFTLQLGIQTIGGRVDAFQIAAILVAFAAGVQLHVNMLGRRLRRDLSDRGLDARELAAIEDQARQTSLRILMRLVPLVAGAAAILFVVQFILGGVRLGLGTIGILAGLVVVTVLAVMAYELLRKGPVPEWTKPRQPGPGGGQPPRFR